MSGTYVHRYSVAEEIANSVTHGVGVVLASAGLTLLVVFAAQTGDPWQIIGGAIFGVTLLVLYTASTLYHSIPHPKAKNVLRVLDHSAIFLLIAGTYTPLSLVNLRGPLGWTLLVVIWTIAFAGVGIAPFLKRYKGAVTATLAAIMGWIAIFAIQPLSQSLGPAGTTLLVAGGLVYTTGIVFYAWRRIPWNHALWHLFVLGGSTLHFFAVLFYCAPGA
jgi:hemolysin III